MTKLDKCLYMIGLAQEEDNGVDSTDRKYIFIFASNDQECWNRFFEKMQGSRQIKADKAGMIAKDIMEMIDSCRIVLEEYKEYKPGHVDWNDESYITLDKEDIRLVDLDYFTLLTDPEDYQRGDLLKPKGSINKVADIVRYIERNEDKPDQFLAQPIAWAMNENETHDESRYMTMSLPYSEWVLIPLPNKIFRAL